MIIILYCSVVFFFTLLLIDKCPSKLAQAARYRFEHFDVSRDIVRKIRIVPITDLRTLHDH